MRRIGWAVGAAALAFAAACNRAPLPLSDAERAAIADSINQMATQMMASFATPATAASVDKMLSYYVKGDALVHAEYGMIYPSYDSLVKGVRAMIRPGANRQFQFRQCTDLRGYVKRRPAGAGCCAGDINDLSSEA